FWWSVIFETAELDFGDYVINNYLEYMAENHWKELQSGFDELKKRGAIPANIKTAEEYIALRLAPPKLKLYINDPAFQRLNIKSETDITGMSKFDLTLKLAKMVVDGSFEKLHNAVYYDLQRMYETRGTSTNVKHKFVSELSNSEQAQLKTEDAKIEYLNDNDRLSQFCELAGIEMNVLTNGDVRRISELFIATDDFTGYGCDFASKQGISLNSYYGERANSEKTQRQRLFKKIRQVSNKTK
ncbi:MAG: hypothetical protein WCA62_04315, partial [Dehalococcoidales bacterium]